MLAQSSTLPSAVNLRNVLFTDALTCAGCGTLMSLAAKPLAALTQIPAGLLLYAGASLFPIAVFMALVGARASRSAPAVWFVVVGNIAWAAASFWLLFSNVIAPNMLGAAFIAAQAAVVVALTALEIRGARALKDGARPNAVVA